VSTRRRVVLATRNAKKLVELRRILAATPALADIEVVGLADVPPFAEPVETELTFAGNALLKARATVAATGLPSLADDSGLCVDALNGMPGVLSARWAGHARSDEANNLLLLDQLDDVPDEHRGARFVAAVALVLPTGTEHVRTGEMAGRVIREPVGANGFGYDPLFVPDGADGSTSAELSAERKDALSHRAAALRALVPAMLEALS
jgi:XTP/dITP diphosphohydrolase